jgi:uncharacterized SAM-binding protein YcdF (DUF218 family)
VFFILSKLLNILFQPANFLLFAMLAGLALGLTRWARAGRRLLAAAVLVLAFCCLTPVATLMLRVLEDRFPPPPRTIPPPAGIVVLGGGLDEDVGFARHDTTLNRAGSRLTTGVALARLYPRARLVFTGGVSDVLQTGHDEAEGVRRLWRDLGVPETQMTFERHSRNTFENAVLTRALVDPKPGEEWLLVTSAWHMPRAMGIFRQAGFPVTPYPVGYMTLGDRRDWTLSLSAVDALDRLDMAFHEWVGLAAYRLTGKTDALFPAP